MSKRSDVRAYFTRAVVAAVERARCEGVDYKYMLGTLGASMAQVAVRQGLTRELYMRMCEMQFDNMTRDVGGRERIEGVMREFDALMPPTEGRHG